MNTRINPMTSHLIAYGYSNDAAVQRLSLRRPKAKSRVFTPAQPHTPTNLRPLHTADVMRKHMNVLNSSTPGLNNKLLRDYCSIRGLDAGQFANQLWGKTIWDPELEEVHPSPPSKRSTRPLSASTPEKKVSKARRLATIRPKPRSESICIQPLASLENTVQREPAPLDEEPAPASLRSSPGRSSSGIYEGGSFSSGSNSPAVSRPPSAFARTTRGAPLLHHYEGESLRLKQHAGLFPLGALEVNTIQKRRKKSGGTPPSLQAVSLNGSMGLQTSVLGEVGRNVDQCGTADEPVPRPEEGARPSPQGAAAAAAAIDTPGAWTAPRQSPPLQEAPRLGGFLGEAEVESARARLRDLGEQRMRMPTRTEEHRQFMEALKVAPVQS